MANRFIAIEKQVEAQTTKSGFIVTGQDLQDMPYRKGKVIAVSPLVSPEIGLSEGMSVYYNNVRALDIFHDGQNIIVIQENDLIAVDV